MKPVGRYDGSLQMFVEETRDLDMARLGFIRWLAERGKLEHRPAGPPAGACVGEVTVEEPVDDWRIPAIA